MADNSLFASKDTEFLAKTLEQYGRFSLAATVAQEELNRKIGIEGVANLQRLGDASSGINKAWAEFNLQLQTALAGPLAGLLEWLTSAINIINKSPSFKYQLNVSYYSRLYINFEFFRFFLRFFSPKLN